MSSSEDLKRNIEVWTKANAEFTDENAREAWAKDEIEWGIWGIPEAELEIIGDVSGLDVVELGCGTAYFSAWLAKRGARVSGVDPTPAQLETARRCMAETGIEFPLIEAPGEDVPLPDASFDRVLSGVRRGDLGRPVPLDPRGGATAPPWRAADLPPGNFNCRNLLPRGRCDCDRASAAVLRHVPLRLDA